MQYTIEPTPAGYRLGMVLSDGTEQSLERPPGGDLERLYEVASGLWDQETIDRTEGDDA